MRGLLAVIANDRHSERNRLAVMLSILAGLRVGEIAALKLNDVVDGEGRVRDQLRLNPASTKGGWYYPLSPPPRVLSCLR